MPPISVIELKDLEWGDWFYGIVAGFIGGGSAAVVGSIAITTVAPDIVLRGGFYKIIWALFIFNGLKDVFLYLAHKPLPTVRTVLETKMDSTGAITVVKKETIVGEKKEEEKKP